MKFKRFKIPINKKWKVHPFENRELYIMVFFSLIWVTHRDPYVYSFLRSFFILMHSLQLLQWPTTCKPLDFNRICIVFFLTNVISCFRYPILISLLRLFLIFFYHDDSFISFKRNPKRYIYLILEIVLNYDISWNDRLYWLKSKYVNVNKFKDVLI